MNNFLDGFKLELAKINYQDSKSVKILQAEDTLSELYKCCCIYCRLPHEKFVYYAVLLFRKKYCKFGEAFDLSYEFYIRPFSRTYPKLTSALEYERLLDQIFETIDEANWEKINQSKNKNISPKIMLNKQELF